MSSVLKVKLRYTNYMYHCPYIHEVIHWVGLNYSPLVWTKIHQLHISSVPQVKLGDTFCFCHFFQRQNYDSQAMYIIYSKGEATIHKPNVSLVPKVKLGHTIHRRQWTPLHNEFWLCPRLVPPIPKFNKVCN